MAILSSNEDNRFLGRVSFYFSLEISCTSWIIAYLCPKYGTKCNDLNRNHLKYQSEMALDSNTLIGFISQQTVLPTYQTTRYIGIRSSHTIALSIVQHTQSEWPTSHIIRHDTTSFPLYLDLHLSATSPLKISPSLLSSGLPQNNVMFNSLLQM